MAPSIMQSSDARLTKLIRCKTAAAAAQAAAAAAAAAAAIADE